MGKFSQPGVDRLIKISSEPSVLSYAWWNVKTIVTEEPAGIVIVGLGVKVALGPVLLPVQNVVPPRLALCKINDLSFPCWCPRS